MAFNAQTLCAQLERMKGERSPRESQWQEVSDLVMPSRFFTMRRSPGEDKGRFKHDDTAAKAAVQLAAAFHGLMTNGSLKWMHLIVADGDDLNQDEDVRAWLQDVVRIMLKFFNSPQFKFNSGAFEVYKDLVLTGTSAIQIIGANDQLTFKPRMMHFTYLAATDGEIDTIFRTYEWTPREVVNLFEKKLKAGRASLPPDTIEALKNIDKSNERGNYCHAVFPRTDRVHGRIDNINKKFASVYFDIERKHIISESGYDEFPYLTPRLELDAEEIYGTCPSINQINDIRMLQVQRRQARRAGELALNPALNVPADGREGPIRTGPGGINYFRKGSRDRISTINQQGANLPFGERTLEFDRQNVRAGYYLDILTPDLPDRANERALIELASRRMILMSPIIGRLIPEWLGPMIFTVFNRLMANGTITPAPEVLRGRDLEVQYRSPLVLNQRFSEIQSMQQLMQVSAPFIDMDPATIDNFDSDAAVRFSATMLDTPSEIFRPAEMVRQIREQRAEQAAAKAQLEQASVAASAAKDGASAAQLIGNAG